MRVADLQKVLAEIDPDLPVVFPNGAAWVDIDAVYVTTIPDFPIDFGNPHFHRVAILEDKI